MLQMLCLIGFTKANEVYNENLTTILIPTSPNTTVITLENASYNIFLMGSFIAFPVLNYSGSGMIWDSTASFTSINSYLKSRPFLTIPPQSSSSLLYVSIASLASIDNRYVNIKSESFALNGCFNNCSSHGYCRKDQCVCNYNYIGSDCNTSIKNITLRQEYYNESISSFDFFYFYFEVSTTSSINLMLQDESIYFIFVLYPKNNDRNEVPSFFNNDLQTIYSLHNDLKSKIDINDNTLLSLFCYNEKGACSIGIHITESINTMHSSFTLALLVIIPAICLLCIIILSAIMYYRRQRSQQQGNPALDMNRLQRKYPKDHWNDTEKETICCVCLEDFCVGVEIRKLACLHLFHVECIDEWFKLNVMCPICKAVVQV